MLAGVAVELQQCCWRKPDKKDLQKFRYAVTFNFTVAINGADVKGYKINPKT